MFPSHDPVEWVCTDPNAIVPKEDAAEVTNWNTTPNENVTFESRQTIIISYKAPTSTPDGSNLTDGILWWSPLTGKMYIRYTQNSISQWIITNPVGILSSTYGLDYVPEGDGGNILPPVLPLPIIPGSDIEDSINKLQKGELIIWFEHLMNFDPGDRILFQAGAPGSESSHIATIVRILEPGAPTAAIVRREDENFQVPDSCLVVNLTKSLYTVTTERPHQLRRGDIVTLSGSEFEEINDTHTIINAGVIDTAQGIATVSAGSVQKLIVTGKQIT